MANSPGLSETHVQGAGNHLGDMDQVARIINEDHSTNAVTPSGGGTVTPDVHVATTLAIQLPAGNITIAAPTAGSAIGPYPGQRLTFVITQDGTGGRTVTWNAAYVGAPLVDPTASAVTVATFINTGSTASPVWRIERTASGVWMTTSGLVVIQSTDTSVQAALARLDTAVANPGPPSGTAGGVLSGDYPDPGFASGAVTNDDVATDAAIEESKVALADDSYATPSRRSTAFRAIVGDYMSDPNPGVAVLGTLTDNLPFMGLFWVPATCTIDTIGVRVTTAGSAGSVLRLGLVETDSDGSPANSTVLSDGTVVGTSTGARTVTFPSPIQVVGGRWYAVAVTSQGTPSTKPILWTSTNPFGFFSNPGNASLFVGYFNNATTSGAYPSSFTTIVGTSNFRPIVWAHIASRP